MIKVGVTGGIGSGKSMVCQVFANLGIPVYNADVRAKQLMNENTGIKEQLISKFGSMIYKLGRLDRALLASIIFSDKESLEFVNHLVHPVVGQDSEKWFLLHQNEIYCVKEAALFFETGTNHEMDLMVTVFAPEELRYQRVMERDGITVDQVKIRMVNQLPEDEKMMKSDFVVRNDDKNSIIEQVINIHQLIISKKYNGKIC